MLTEYERIKLKREELYGLVWSEPMSKLSERFGLSDVGLAKICRKMNIPRPARGYWQKKTNGYDVEPDPLPPLRKDDQREVSIKPKCRGKIMEQEHDEISDIILFEKLPANKITTKDTLHRPHDLVAQTQALFKGTKPDDKGLLRASGKGCLDIRVSPKELPRALRIMDALIKALEVRGYTVFAKEKGFRSLTHLSMLGVDLEIGLQESYRQIERELTPQELRRKEKDRFFSIYPRYIYQPSGNLAVIVKEPYLWDIQKTWSDGKKQRLENILNAVIIGLTKAARRNIEIEAKRKADHEAWLERARKREEQERLAREKEARIQTLKQQVEAWRRSQDIRAFVEAVRQATVESGGEIIPESDIGRWIIWALETADQLDPLVSGNTVLVIAANEKA